MGILLRLAARAARHPRRLALAYACTLGATLFSLAVPRLLGVAVDSVLQSGVRLHLLWLALAILGASLARGALAYGQGYLGEWVSQRVAYELRNAFYDRLQRLSFGYHDHQRTGDLMSKATADVEGVRRFVNFGLLRAAHVTVLFAGVAVLLLLMHPWLGLMSLAFLPALGWRSIVSSRALRRIWLGVQDTLGRLTTVLQENLAGVRVVKAFGAEEHERRRFHREASGVARLVYAAERVQAANTSVLTLAFSLATLLIVWYGGRLVAAGQLTPGELAQFVFFMGLLMMPVRTLGWLVNTFSRAASAGERIFAVLDAESPVRERPGARQVGRVRGAVSFENLSLHYDGGRPTLHRLDLAAAPGQVTAILGPPGSGKSSLLHLVPRFYDPTEGRVTIDGVDVRDLTLESVRRSVGMVMQDVFLFTATIRENIAYGVPWMGEEEVERAARLSQLHEFVTSLPRGYDTIVGERGVTLSGGQRQRLAIARTLLLDPPILVLDDATSSVDAETERRIQEALRTVIRGRTTFVVAHRLSTVREADELVVLEEGRIVERGTHRELLERDGRFRRLYRELAGSR